MSCLSGQRSCLRRKKARLNRETSMDVSEVKRKMMALWKETFHDSDEYISLIFDEYFDPELVEYTTNGPEIVGALMGIPYEFGGAQNQIRGLYLCGLATKQRWRGQGVMTRLLEDINNKAKEKGYSFTFLIPENELLVRYYARRGYVNAFYRNELNYTSVHDFVAEYDVMLEGQKDKVAALKRRYFKSLIGNVVDDSTSEETLEGIKRLMLADEEQQCDLEVLHTTEDMDTLIRENHISGGHIYYTANSQGTVTAVAFTTLVERSRVHVERLYASDLCSRYRLLDYIKKVESDAGIRVYCKPRESEHKGLSQPHGMAHILNLYEILKFQAAGHGDLKYSILVNGSEEGMLERFDIRGGNVKQKIIPSEADSNDNIKTVMSIKDISCILFRRPDKGSLIMEAFGMPSLNGYLCVMLD